jgi:hypothetical protein
VTQTARRQHADAPQFSPERLKAFIETRLRRREEPAWIANAVPAYFGVAIDADQVVPYWKGEITLPTQTEHRPDKESVHPADEPEEPDFTLIADVEAPRRVFELAATPPATQTGRRRDGESLPDADDAPATQTGHRQDAETLPDADDAPATQTGRRQDLESLPDADDAPATQTGHRQDAETLPDADDAPVTQTGRRQDAESLPDADDAATQTGRRPDQKTKSILTDEVKAFIVRGLARYETPTRVAASVAANFGIEIDRRQVFAYDPACSRPPAQRWIDLHAATRAKFLGAIAEIGIAQKVVRLRMLDRFANRADENNQMERAAAFLVQAAKECGGFYERFARPKGDAARVAA